MTENQIKELRRLLRYYQAEYDTAYCQPLPDNRAYWFFTRGRLTAINSVFRILDIETEEENG